MNDADRIMKLAHDFANARADHAVAVHDFANNRSESYDDIPPLAKAWLRTEKALRAAIEEVAK